MKKKWRSAFLKLVVLIGGHDMIHNALLIRSKQAFKHHNYIRTTMVN